VADVVSGVAKACGENGCALLGGETAQMPDFYADDEYDLAGFIVGVVARDRILDGSRVAAGDVLVGLPSSGLHTNGYTLARNIVFDQMGLRVDDEMPELGRSVADVLLQVHRSYLRPVSPLLESDAIHGLAHITGGGLPGNLPRILPEGLGAVVDRGSWDPGPLFRLLQRAGDVERDEMYRVFNMGVGMIAVVARDRVDGVLGSLQSAGEAPWVLGEVEEGNGVRYAG
jgi:phosphoribosylformylglycinamidine cyclo-ligase